MGTINLLYRREYRINDNIKIYIPTVGEVLDDEDNYYSIVSMLTAMPIDMMVQLDDAGIDFSTINEYDLFMIMFSSLGSGDLNTSMVFGDLDLSNFQPAVRDGSSDVVLIDSKNDIVIDRSIHVQIANALRKIHHLEKNNKKPANDDSKKFMIERARSRLKRQQRKMHESQLESLIIAMVNAEQYKYDYEGTRELSIYQFNESVRQIINKVDYNNRMIGVYTGNINAKELSQDDLNWLTHK